MSKLSDRLIFVTIFSLNDCLDYRIRGAATTSHFDLAPIQVETWDDLMIVGKHKKAAKPYVQLQNAEHTIYFI